jgi:2'-5' RNA ligase
MSNLLALDVAILPPRDVSERAKRLNAQLPAAGFRGLRLDETHLPHITLTQQFVRIDDIERVLEGIARSIQATASLGLRVPGLMRGGSSVSIAVERTPHLVALHERLMDALKPFEQGGGSAAAFAGGDARAEDVSWASGYRSRSSFGAFQPHITVGHTEHPPHIEPFEFTATTVAACHLGRFCTCMRVLQQWNLS